MVKKKRTAAQFFDDAELNGLESLIEANMNSDKVSKHIESGTEINYNRMLVLWDEYVRRNLGASPHDIIPAKRFIEGVVRGCIAGKKEPSMYTMLQKWTDFGAGWFCVERIKLDPIKRRRLTRQSSLNVKVFFGASVRLEHHCDLLNEESHYKHVNETMDSPMLEPLDVIFLEGSVRLEETSGPGQRYSLPSIDPIANQEKRSSPAASFAGSECPLSSIDWNSDDTLLGNPTPASSVNSSLPLSIDPRLLNVSEPQPTILRS
ncbi:MAG: hypothetical protein M1825_006415 [Sarcosagium campestre]|nr:MAG: hypothetical protein M1825_006415 [Sarcosagium campestre]